MIVLSSIVAAAVVIAQGLAVWGFLKFVKSFGAYTLSQQAMTNALLYTHESNLAVHHANLRILDELRTIHTHAKGAA